MEWERIYIGTTAIRICSYVSMSCSYYSRHMGSMYVESIHVCICMYVCMYVRMTHWHFVIYTVPIYLSDVWMCSGMIQVVSVRLIKI